MNRRYTILQLHLDLSHEPEVVGRGLRQVEGTRRSSFCLESRSRFHLKTLELDPAREPEPRARHRLARHSTHVKPPEKSENPCLPPTKSIGEFYRSCHAEFPAIPFDILLFSSWDHLLSFSRSFVFLFVHPLRESFIARKSLLRGFLVS